MSTKSNCRNKISSHPLQEYLNSYKYPAWIMQDADTFCLANEYYLQLTGHESMDFNEKKLSDVFAPKDAAFLHSQFSDVFKRGVEGCFEMSLCTESGEMEEFKVHYHPLYETSLKEIQFIFFISTPDANISWNTKHIHAVAKYQKIIKNISTPLCHFRPSGEIIFSNEAFNSLFDQIDLPEGKLNPLLLFPVEDREAAINHIRSFTPGEPCRLSEHRIIGPANIPTWQLWSLKAFFDAEENITEYQAICMDITALKNLQNLLKNENSRYQDELETKYEEVLHINEELEKEILNKKTVEAKMKKHIQLVEKSFKECVDVMMKIMEKRDPYTFRHQKRVAHLAFKLGLKLNLPNKKLKGLYLASLLHDVGKIYVPVDFLSKPDNLSNLEYTVIQTHVEAGYQILKEIEFPWPISEIVLQHHERIDGTGYPKGLVENQILLEAKILAVCDVVEAMLSHRPYRPALSRENVLRELNENRGLLYDESVVDACIQIIFDENFHFEQTSQLSEISLLNLTLFRIDQQDFSSFK